MREKPNPSQQFAFPVREKPNPTQQFAFPVREKPNPSQDFALPVVRAKSARCGRGALNGGKPAILEPQRASSRRNHHADAGSAKQLLWFDRTGTTEGVVGEPVTDALFFAKLSPDERRIAINQSVQGSMDLWLLDFGRGGKTRLTFDPSRNSTSLRQTGN